MQIKTIYLFVFQLNCCGVNNYTEWQGVKMRFQHDPQIPISCCKNRIAFCTDDIDFKNPSQASESIFVEVQQKSIEKWEELNSKYCFHHFALTFFLITTGLL